MPYKTVSVKLQQPTAKKRAYLNEAIQRYSTAFEILLRQCKECFADSPPNKAALMKKMDKAFFQSVNYLNVEPFKDALKLDLAKLLSIYYASLKQNPRRAFPVTRTDYTELDAYVDGENCSRRQVNLLLNKFENQRPLLFCRFDDKRDYSIVKNGQGRYYAKLYLFNRKTAPGRERFLYFPLDAGSWQNEFMDGIFAGSATPKSAELLKRSGEYFLNIRFWYEALEPKSVSTYLGIARGLNAPLCFAVADKSGLLLTQGSLSASNCSGINKLHHLANAIVSAAQQYNSQIVLANLTARSDGLKMDGFLLPLSVGEYNQIARLAAYKAEFQGLPLPIPVSGNSLFFKCPKCGNFKRANRFGYDKFICIQCGHSSELEDIGSANLARMLIVYKKNKVPVLYLLQNNQMQFWLEALEFSFQCEAGPGATHQFAEALQKHIARQYAAFDKAKQFTARKLKGEKTLEQLHFVETRSLAR